MINCDFIGDIHGHADKLIALLKKLGYYKNQGVFKHAERQVIFVGDLIDRGPKNPEVVELVRKMVDAGHAQAICGNHEYNAICYNTLGPKGYLRPHTAKNTHQHAATLAQFQGKDKEYQEAINWFRTLPLFLETEHFRVVHAAWDQQAVQYLKSKSNKGVLEAAQYEEASDKSTKLHQVVELLCKGREVDLPPGVSFKDKDGVERFNIRIKWWLNPQGKRIKEMSVIENLENLDGPFKSQNFEYYKPEEKVVFFGHYWLKGIPVLCAPNACCLDFSVAKNGYLCAYRFNGERVLSEDNFVFV